ncbi:MAG: hypothetical protein H0U89_11670 [Acidimicrobiia bacterium]|nr:hypothetical protein [Acidimicrobiia bacterium]
MVDLLPDASNEEVRAFVTAQLEDRPLRPDPGPYPYVVTRHFPAVYSSRRVVWDESDHSEPSDVVIRCEAPFEGGRLRDEACALVVAFARAQAAATGFRHCAVFAERDAVYVDPGGTTSASTDPPRWGRSVNRRPGGA